VDKLRIEVLGYSEGRFETPRMDDVQFTSTCRESHESPIAELISDELRFNPSIFADMMQDCSRALPEL